MRLHYKLVSCDNKTMKNTVILITCFGLCLAASAQTLEVGSFRHAGPYPVVKPYEVDTVDIAGKTFDVTGILDAVMPFDALKNAGKVSSIPAESQDALHLVGFAAQNTLYSKTKVEVKGLKDYRLYMDGKKVSGQEVKMEPGTHEFVIKYLTSARDTIASDSLKVLLTPDKDGKVSLREDGRRIYSLDINTIGAASGGVSISPRGGYVALTHALTDSEGKSDSYTEILRSSDGSFVSRTSSRVQWMPSSDRFWYTRKTVSGKDLVCCDPATGLETVLAKGVPDEYFTIAPTEDYLILHMTQEGPKEGEVHQILTPDDRQPGWRDRSYLSRYDLSTGLSQQLTFGWHNAYLEDISADGKTLLVRTSRERLTKRPTTLYSLYTLDVATLEASCLVADDGFISGAQFSPDGRKVLIQGSPEALGGIGKDVLEGQIPNQFDGQAYVMDIASGKIDPITLKFAPSVSSAVWNKADGKIYLAVEDKDLQTIYRMEPDGSKAEKLSVSEEYIRSFSLSDTTPALVYSGQSLCNGDRAYIYDTKKDRERLLCDFSAERLADTDMGEGLPYEFTSRNGDLINGFYVLPPDFDPSRKYPLLVHYYGGCSPSSRYCIGSYSPQVYAAQGYIFYVINPSGAAGFGQEFAARHVNTAGDVVADDIIEGTKRFCEDHPYVDTAHIGCFSASYGGFMTQLLLSKTDIYATGISHAGISGHTSYWGEGYWGYSYSECSMADSYPWTRKDLYVDRSPIYFPDRIHTPLLFLHGSADTNVPIGESIQMFTALKLLGEDTAFVVVDGENHGIREFSKRRQWLRTIFAWFSKYLQDDDTWWNELYPEKNL